MEMTLYDFNKSGYASLPDMDTLALQSALNYIKEYLVKNTTFCKYWLLLSNENKYYTIFHRSSKNFSFEILAYEILDIVKHLGGIKSVEENQETKALEFWIDYNGDCCLFLLFPYDRGVIEV